MQLRLKFFFIIVLFTIASFAKGQITSSSLSGLVKDNSGPLAGATIKAYYQKTGVQYDVNTSRKGNFRLNNLNPGGPYTIEVSYSGYQTQKIENYFLKLGADEYLDFHLNAVQVQLSENGNSPSVSDTGNQSDAKTKTVAIAQ